MCMKYVNVNVQCFEINTNAIFGNREFSSLLDSVKAEQKNDKYSIGGFSIVTFINIRGTINEGTIDNPLNNKENLDFRIRLTKLNEDKSKQTSYNLKDFSIDLSDNSVVHKACFDYMERIEITNVDGLVLDELGAYVIKVLVKASNSDMYDVQMVHPLYIK